MGYFGNGAAWARASARSAGKAFSTRALCFAARASASSAARRADSSSDCAARAAQSAAAAAAAAACATARQRGASTSNPIGQLTPVPPMPQ